MVFGIKEENTRAILTIFVAVLYFQSIPRFSFIGPYFEQYPIIVFGIATLFLFKIKPISKFLSG